MEGEEGREGKINGRGLKGSTVWENDPPPRHQRAGFWPVITVGKMRILFRINIRILPVLTSAFYTSPLGAITTGKCYSYGPVRRQRLVIRTAIVLPYEYTWLNTGRNLTPNPLRTHDRAPNPNRPRSQKKISAQWKVKLVTWGRTVLFQPECSAY